MRGNLAKILIMNFNAKLIPYRSKKMKIFINDLVVRWKELGIYFFWIKNRIIENDFVTEKVNNL